MVTRRVMEGIPLKGCSGSLVLFVEGSSIQTKGKTTISVSSIYIRAKSEVVRYVRGENGCGIY